VRGHEAVAPPISNAARPTWTTILKGAKPAALPFEQPTKYEPVINLRVAKATGLTIPESFILRAD
jgi:ABC-type uncharacterized transport system substrate-binding protein